ncbi:MAG: N-6 DNA methylase [Phycisphaerae bacterium]|nr:N-6 DNA methylase [Phycisphaerae bacterium]
MARRRSEPQQTPLFPFGGFFNCDLFSNHWLEHRLPLEPEWAEVRAESDAALARATELWQHERGRVKQYGNEASLEQAFIQPLFEILGWKLIYQTHLQRRRPDYALFLNDESKDAALEAGKKTTEFWNHPAILADAKAWHISLDRPTRVGNQREYPPEQIEWYLDRSRLDFAILTNARLWRLIPRQLAPGKARFQTYLDVDISRLLDARLDTNSGQRSFDADLATAEEFFRFYLFFSPRAFESRERRMPLVERALRGSSEYALSVGEDLKQRVFEALRLCIEGFLTYAPNALDPARDLELCREQSFVLLYRLLFIMYAEDRALLPYRRNRLYTENRSLARHRDEIADSLARIDQGREPDYTPGQTAIWQDLVSLSDLIDRGHARYGVPAYNGGLFDADRHEFLAEKKLPDRYLARVIDQLGRAEDPQHRERGLFRVDYRDLAIQHLGSIYEGLLELRPHFATEPMIVIRERRATQTTERIIGESERVSSGWEPTGTHYETGDVYLQTDKGERRATGSYYTPDHIVSYIVDKTLGPLCRGLSHELSAEIAEIEEKCRRARGKNREALDTQLEKLREDFDDRVLRLRILDPAMGSGHFLVRACQYLAEEIATNPCTGDLDADQLQEDESILTYWKRRVVESSIFGVDLNPMAVELAKLALWLETVSADAPLSFLDHHLRPGNSLIGARVAELGALPGALELQQNLFKQQVEQQLPLLLEPLIKIRELPSQTAQQIKEKDKLYRRMFQPLCRMFRTVANLWCSTFFASEPGASATGQPRHSRRAAGPARSLTLAALTEAVTPEQYQQALSALQRTADFKKLAKEPWLAVAVGHVETRHVFAFHWELEFPEVFFDLSRQDADASFHRGFDAVIGNPPWGHAASLNVLEQLSRFQPVADDHAECFMCLGVELLAPGGRFGMVLPDTILSPAKHGIRRHMLTRAQTVNCYNIGPDWFTSKVRMSAVLWLATGIREPIDDYLFHTCVLPIEARRACQGEQLSLSDAIGNVEREASARACRDEPECAIPLFGDSNAVDVMERTFRGAPTLSDLCDHARGVELNKAGEAFQCPHCGSWDAPPRRDPNGEFREKTCARCGQGYRIDSSEMPRVLVTDQQERGAAWKPYIDGDSIRRYSAATIRYIDTSANGINYKPASYYRSPKILIRQAGIGVNAILDVANAYCPQSVYIYHVNDRHRSAGIDEQLVLSFLCSRLFHLQVFMSFGEIDSSRAFSKLTHTRLSRLRVLDPAALAGHVQVVQRIRHAVATLSSHGIASNDQEDWDIEACWGAVFGLSKADIEGVICNFSHVHANETLLSLFPDGVCGRESHWVSVWEQAAKRCGVPL